MKIRIVPDFGSSKSGIWPFFGNPAKSGSAQISSQIWQIPVQLQYIQLITGKTNADDQSSGVFAILICATRMTKIQNSLPFYKFSRKLAETLQRKH